MTDVVITAFFLLCVYVCYVCLQISDSLSYYLAVSLSLTFTLFHSLPIPPFRSSLEVVDFAVRSPIEVQVLKFAKTFPFDR